MEISLHTYSYPSLIYSFVPQELSTISHEMKQTLARDNSWLESLYGPSTLLIIVFDTYSILMSASHKKIQLLQSTEGQELHTDIVSQLFSYFFPNSLTITVIVVRSIFISWSCHGV